MKKVNFNYSRFIWQSFMGVALCVGSPSVALANGVSVAATNNVQQTTVRGTVVDASGEPMIGVTVTVKGSSSGTVTGLDGSFSLNCKPTDVLVFSYVGYVNQELRANANLSRIVLKEDNAILDEVVVIGYGTTTRKSAVGAVDQVRSDLLENRPVANVTQALQGAAPNVIIQRKNYNPNAQNNNFNIRGISTLNDNSPLFVIDGLVTDYDNFNRLNPNDIENISILKDAGTAAIYGSRSANGVVLVTTKKGKNNERTSIRLNGMVGWEDPHILFTPVTGYQNAVLRNMAETNVGNAPVYSQDQILDFYAHQDEERWALNEIFQTAMQQNYNISISGGSDKTTYMVSAGYFDQGSNYVSNQKFGLQRYNFRTNLVTELGRLKLTATLAYTRTDSKNTTGSSLEIDASRVPSSYIYKMKSADGRYLLNDVWGEFNPLGQLESGGFDKYRTNAVTASVTGELKIIDGLKLRGVFGADVVGNNRYSRNMPSYYYAGEDATEPRPRKDSDFKTSNWNADNYRLNTQILLDYNKTFGIHTVNGLFGATNESYTWYNNEIWKNYVDPDLGTSTSITTGEVGNIGGATTVDSSGQTSITSLLGRIGYNYNERYYAEFDFRYDGSSKFHKDYRWGFFPSLSLGWRISEEPFMEKYREKVGDLKIRGSYGILGSQAVGDYDRYTRYSVSSTTYAYNNQAVAGAGFNLGLKDLTWERTNTFNIGFDASFLHNALNITFDYYTKRTKDILMKPLQPSVFGTTMPSTNIGEMSNDGWELSINYRLKTGDMKHNFYFNIGDSKNKVTKFPGNEQISGVDEIYKIIRVGEALNSYYAWQVEGIFQSYDEIKNSALPLGAEVAPGDLKFKDQNGDNVIDSNDRVIVGNAFPRYTFGFTYRFEWKGFDFSMFWQGVGKRSQMLRGELLEPYHSNYSYVMYKHQLDFWTPTNTDAKYPRLAAQGSASDTNNWGRPSDIFVLDAKYARLKNLAIGYSLPKKWIDPMGLQKLRVYVTGQDLLTLTKNSFIDPESSEFGSNMNSGGGNSGRNYPMLQYYGFGFDVEF
ncbi:TonB-linked outer membrane protein, SusC/RagA family [Xylanibacter ruminicola]|uniref:TonB-linked outer membrane protein, SusC/RagA family n=1 Tax=Xylanibacter ruminicola TaxID=839 RepID=A0A1H3XHA7_XYLRU|nr:TonB-linked outer membrane protein, SusC/RagA family [Xylanibacter ruminicola]